MRFAAVLLALLSFGAHAQMTIDFSAETTTADGVVTPVLTWSTSPAADSCVASGSWSGEKGASGTETLAPTSASGTYNLECTWPGDSIATYSWEWPTTNTDGSPFVDPQLVKVKHGFADEATLVGTDCEDGRNQGLFECFDAPYPQSMHTVTGVSGTGEYNGIAYAVNQLNKFSEPSNVATKVFTGNVTVTESVGIVVNPVPNPLVLSVE